MTGYTDTIRRWATDPRRAGTLENPDGIGEVGLGAEETGSRLAVRFALKVRDGRVEKVRFQVFGCGFTMAACAAAADLAEGRPLEAVAGIDDAAVGAVLGGLPDERDYCAELAVQALQAAVTAAKGVVPTVTQTVRRASGEEHGPRLSAEDPVYRRLMDSPPPPGATEEDRHLFACLLAVATQETAEPDTALGLAKEEVGAILRTFFPAVEPKKVHRPEPLEQEPPPPANEDVRNFLLAHVPRDAEGRPVPASHWLARTLATRAAHPGHLWIAMGFFRRPQLSAAIRRHLPSLAEANHQGMRWKRFFFKQVCDLSGGGQCKAPTCGQCSDYALCFAPE